VSELSQSADKSLNQHPLRLTADNYTPLTRTPWAGTAISKTIKSLVSPDCVGEKIGESWEFSCDPSFPSYVLDAKCTLLEWSKEHCEDILTSAAIAAGNSEIEILVKLLNPDLPLSLQVHPFDDDVNLKTEECGKPESWLVLSAAKGAGIYLGFSKSFSKSEITTALKNGEDLTPFLNFIEVSPGDYFEILPGVTHAIGPGVVLLEPQRVLQGKSGKTFRIWDWNRLYDSRGELDPSGEPRELHIEQAMAIIDPVNHTGTKFMKSVIPAKTVSETNGIQTTSFAKNEYYQTHLVEYSNNKGDDSEYLIELEGGYAILIMLEGVVAMGNLIIKKGEPCLLPASCLPLKIDISENSSFALIHPSYAKLKL
jgi:mannose-6-phosphate isomerase